MNNKRYTGLPLLTTLENHLAHLSPQSIPQRTQSLHMCACTHTHTPTIAECARVSFFCVFTYIIPSTWNSLSPPSTFQWSIHPLITSSIVSSSWELDAPLHCTPGCICLLLNKLYCNYSMLPWVSDETVSSLRANLVLHISWNHIVGKKNHGV